MPRVRISQEEEEAIHGLFTKVKLPDGFIFHVRGLHCSGVTVSLGPIRGKSGVIVDTTITSVLRSVNNWIFKRVEDHKSSGTSKVLPVGISLGLLVGGPDDLPTPVVTFCVGLECLIWLLDPSRIGVYDTLPRCIGKFLVSGRFYGFGVKEKVGLVKEGWGLAVDAMTDVEADDAEFVGVLPELYTKALSLQKREGEVLLAWEKRAVPPEEVVEEAVLEAFVASVAGDAAEKGKGKGTDKKKKKK